MERIADRLGSDHPQFHRYATGEPASWNSNLTLLGRVEEVLSPGMRTIEIGCGYSTVVFLQKECEHTCISLDADEIKKVRQYCAENGIASDTVEFYAGSSTDILPGMEWEPYDVVLIDGAHRFPYPIVDWHYLAPRLTVGGLMVIDDTDLTSCEILLEFMLSDQHWRAEQMELNYALFRKVAEPSYASDWVGQPFSQKGFLAGLYHTKHQSDLAQRAPFGRARRVAGRMARRILNR